MTFSTPSIPLNQLLQALPGGAAGAGSDVLVTNITQDSRQVGPGSVFVAAPGVNTDGHRYIPSAVERGAVAVVGTQPITDLSVPYIQVSDSRLALAQLVAELYGHPARRLVMTGVTGTDGKTTTSSLIYQILKAAGLTAGLISTVGAVFGEQEVDTGFHVTTPDAPEIQKYLAEMAVSGATHAVLEATSHGLEQQRAAACEFDIAVVTNITHEHLDYHGSYEGYRAAKARLITSLWETVEKPGGNYRIAVLNRDDESYEYLSDLIERQNAGLPAGSSKKVRTITYGFHPEAEVRAADERLDVEGLSFTATGPGYQLRIDSRLVGLYNISNCLAAIAATVSGLGLAPEAAREGIASLAGITGRMERIDLGQDFTAIVDFAHTPNALRKALSTARKLVEGRPDGERGRVIAVFGSAGLRDRKKRSMMAEISAELADLTVLTAEDPRTEDLDQILTEMAAGAERRGGQEGRTFWRVPDRGEALRFAVRLARPGDILLTCGKGHEQSMCFGETEYAWDDNVALRAALSEYLGIPGPEMPYLPTSGRQAPPLPSFEQ